MSFEPTNVKSYYQPVGWEPHEVVAKSDYDELLALYTAEVEGRKDDALESRANAERWSD